MGFVIWWEAVIRKKTVGTQINFSISKGSPEDIASAAGANLPRRSGAFEDEFVAGRPVEFLPEVFESRRFLFQEIRPLGIFKRNSRRLWFVQMLAVVFSWRMACSRGLMSVHRRDVF